MIEKILKYIVKKIYPNRDISVKKVRKKYFFIQHNTLNFNHFLLEGTYNYSEVVKLNDITTYNASFGYCENIGPVAFIGIPNIKRTGINGYFRYTVEEYGSTYNNDEYYFQAYSKDEAKLISNYTVYGFSIKNDNFQELIKVAKISKLNLFYDTRYIYKNAEQNKIYDMDCKLAGTYNFYTARKLATGTIKDKKWFSVNEEPIVFARVDGNYNVGIIGIWSSDIKLIHGFRDVWEYDFAEPPIQQIEILSDEEAKKADNFILYIYNAFSLRHGKYIVSTIDRTLDKRFNFHMPDGNDYRLIEHNELFR